jgi:16S rRNA (uracil1498-N3)-methyltransferase
MAACDCRTQRLYVDAPLGPGARMEADGAQANYLLNVLRLRADAPVLLFNGRDGEWRARIAEAGKRRCVLEAVEKARDQTPLPDLHYLFAPLKYARLDYMVQKAVEMGAAVLRPVLTRHAQVSRVNLERMRANAVEAAEQCGLLALAEIREPVRLEAALAEWDGRRLIFCDEDAAGDPLATLGRLSSEPPGPLAVLIGPEGGFAEDERARLKTLPFVTAISLGPRILRADTAAVAALALVQAVLGDWRPQR